LTDVYLRFKNVERAKEVRGKIDGQVLEGRLLRVVVAPENE
jgi:hypothetical protein